MEEEPQRFFSPEDVRNLFPEGHRPSLRLLISKAKEAGTCLRLGKGIVFTKQNIEDFTKFITLPGHADIRRRVSQRDVGHSKARKLLAEVREERLNRKPRKRKLTFLEDKK